MPKSAQQMTQNYMAGMQNPQTATKYKQGIQNFQGNPMALAASPQAEQLYITRVTQSVTSGKRSAKLNAVPVDRWRNNSINTGATLLGTGAGKAQDKVSAHFAKWQPVYQQASDAARAIPKDGSLGSAMARVQAALQVMMAAAGKG